MSKAVLIGEQKELSTTNITINDFFEKMVNVKPNEIAVIDEKHYYTYKEYNEMSNRIARTLLRCGIVQKDVVAICFERSVHMMAVIMAIMKIGAIYVPIGLTFPPDRVEFILMDSKAKVLLLQDRSMIIESNIDILVYNDLDLDKDVCNVDVKFSTSDIAYILYTSGSTGRPKGVKVQHEAIINHIMWRAECCALNAMDIFFFKTPYTFDISVWEMFLWFFVGAKVFICAEGKERNVNYIINEIAKREITICQFVPSMLSELLKYVKHRNAAKKLASLRLVFSGGEVLHTSVVDNFRDILTKQYGTLLFNVYGPTETTIDSTYFCCTEENVKNEMQEMVPIGFPIWNTAIYIIDEQGRICDEGTEGEIIVVGKGVASGYVGNVKSDAFAEIDSIGEKKTYRTGDMGKIIEGHIEFCGRRDQQIKIRGMRVELEEIEARIDSIDEIVKSAVVYDERQEIGRLCALYVADEPIEASIIKENLSRFLPDYMIPDEYKQVRELIYTSSGKLDRSQIKKIYLNAASVGEISSEAVYNDILSKDENAVLNVIMKTINNNRISPETTLLDLGINSLMFINIIITLEDVFDIVCDGEMLVPNQYDTVFEMVKYVASLINPVN